MKRAIPRLRDWFVAFFSIFLLCFIVQSSLYAYRNKIDSLYTRVGEERLYAATPCLANIKDYGKGQVGLYFDLGKINGYTLQKKNLIFELVEQQELKLKLSPGENILAVRFGLKDAFDLRFSYIPTENYQSAGNFDYPLGVVLLKKSSICIGRPIFPDVTHWDFRGGSQAPEAAIALLDGHDIENILARVIVELEAKRGTPSSSAESASIMKMRDMVQTNRSQVWCSQIAAYAVASLSSSIGVRLVTSNGTLFESGVLAGGHAFIEILDHRTNKWALADPTNYILKVTLEDETLLSARDLQHIVALDKPELLQSLIFRIVDPLDGRVASLRWKGLNAAIRENISLYFSPVSKLYYHAGESAVYSKSVTSKIDNWIRVDRRFVISHVGDAPLLAWMRIGTFYLMMLSLFACLLVLGVRFFSRSSVRD